MALPPTAIYRFLSYDADVLYADLTHAKLWNDARTKDELAATIERHRADERAAPAPPPGLVGPSGLNRFADTIQSFLNEVGRELARCPVHQVETLSAAAREALRAHEQAKSRALAKPGSRPWYRRLFGQR